MDTLKRELQRRDRLNTYKASQDGVDKQSLNERQVGGRNAKRLLPEVSSDYGSCRVL